MVISFFCMYLPNFPNTMLSDQNIFWIFPLLYISDSPTPSHHCFLIEPLDQVLTGLFASSLPHFNPVLIQQANTYFKCCQILLLFCLKFFHSAWNAAFQVSVWLPSAHPWGLGLNVTSWRSNPGQPSSASFPRSFSGRCWKDKDFISQMPLSWGQLCCSVLTNET